MAIAVDLGWLPGVRSDYTVYPVARPLYFLDCHWTDYDWPRHLAVAQRERPTLASVPDILMLDGLPLALAQAEELAPYCESLLITPKVDAGLLARSLLPRKIGNREIILGYSVPTRYGASPLPLWSYAGWPVHLLGGTPRRQVALASYLHVVSADGNVAQKLAHRGLIVDQCGHHVPFAQAVPGDGMPGRALRLSLQHIHYLWQRRSP